MLAHKVMTPEMLAGRLGYRVRRSTEGSSRKGRLWVRISGVSLARWVRHRKVGWIIANRTGAFKVIAELAVTVCHEHEGGRVPNVRNYLIDEGRPLGIGLQERISNHLRRLWSKAMVVSAEGKGLGRTRSGD